MTSNTTTFVVEERSEFMTFIYLKNFGECGFVNQLEADWVMGHFYRFQNEFVVYVYFRF